MDESCALADTFSDSAKNHAILDPGFCNFDEGLLLVGKYAIMNKLRCPLNAEGNNLGPPHRGGRAAEQTGGVCFH